MPEIYAANPPRAPGTRIPPADAAAARRDTAPEQSAVRPGRQPGRILANLALALVFGAELTWMLWRVYRSSEAILDVDAKPYNWANLGPLGWAVAVMPVMVILTFNLRDLSRRWIVGCWSLLITIGLVYQVRLSGELRSLVLNVVVSLAALLLTPKLLQLIRPHCLTRWWFWLLASGLIIVPLWIPRCLGMIKNYTYAWILVQGHSFQPSATSTVGYIYAGAYLLAVMTNSRFAAASGSTRARSRPYWTAAIGWMLLTIALTVSLAAVKDYGAALSILVFAIGFCLLAGQTGLALFAGGLSALVLVGGIWKGVIGQRIEIFLHPFADPNGLSYQGIRALASVKTGNLVGPGLGQGLVPHIPEEIGDYIYTKIIGDLGILAGIALAALFAAIFLLAVSAARRSPNRFASNRLIGAGLFLLIQAAVNIASATGLTPATGLTLPFISDGGSSLLAAHMLLGLLVFQD